MVCGAGPCARAVETSSQKEELKDSDLKHGVGSIKVVCNVCRLRLAVVSRLVVLRQPSGCSPGTLRAQR